MPEAAARAGSQATLAPAVSVPIVAIEVMPVTGDTTVAVIGIETGGAGGGAGTGGAGGGGTAGSIELIVTAPRSPRDAPVELIQYEVSPAT
jgi:hypothetical protein